MTPLLLLLSLLLPGLILADCSGAPPANVWSICKNCSDLPEYLLKCEEVLDLGSLYNDTAAIEFKEKYGKQWGRTTFGDRGFSIEGGGQFYMWQWLR